MTEGPSLKSVLVQGSLAYAMRRASAARDSEHGLQIMTATSLAARLAGGLLRPASRESIEVGVRTALARADLLDEIFPIRDLPGAARAVLRTLGDVWRAGYDLRSADAASKPRLRDLARIEDEMRLHLQPGELLLPDLCRLARQAVRFGPRVIGSLRLEGVHAVDPIWRPLINDLCDTIDVEWMAPPCCDAAWFKGRLRQASRGQGTQRDISCADPYHEALKAMRWARELLSSGKAKAGEIAIATTAPFACDDYMLALASGSSLPLCFVHGRPALATRDGQRCAALADALQGGLGQARIRRLLALAVNQGTVLDGLPDGRLPVSSEASLSSAAEWERALAANASVSSILMPVIRLLEMGTSQAEAAGKLLLRGRARNLWDDALRAAPASALMFSLQALRVADDRDPADSIAWCSVDQLAAAPRRFAWLMGLNTKSWPRNSGRDPMLPGYIVPRALIDPDPLEISDRRCFENVVATAQLAVLSSARLSGDGKRIGQSTLQASTETLEIVPREQPALHALTEADRLLARPQDRADNPIVSSAVAAWNDRRSARLTPYDGMVGGSHPALSSLLEKPQSPTSLSRLLRDPLAYVWYYALGWRDLVHKERGLILPADDMGRLVHELLRRTVDHLEPEPGFKAAARHEIEDALAAAAAHVLATWPLETNVPPPVLWESTVRQAVKLSLAGLTFETLTEADTRSWTEVPFGGGAREAASSAPLPWDPEQPVFLPGTDIRIQGTIDRLDLRTVAEAVRVTDYKTGQRPKAPEKINIGGGAELQRVLYSLACRQLLPDITRVAARLIYLRPPVEAYALESGRQLGDLVANWVRQARIVLESGVIYPGIAVMPERFGKIALPASAGYIDWKSSAIREAAGRDLAAFWGSK